MNPYSSTAQAFESNRDKVNGFSHNRKGFEEELNRDAEEANNYFEKESSEQSNQQDSESVSLDELLNKHQIKATNKILTPPTLIEIQGVKYASIIATLGNFMAVIGKAKSRKTFFVSLLIAAFIYRNTLMNRIRCCVDNEKCKAVLFDTEQSTYHVQKVLFRILLTAKIKGTDDLEVFALRTIPPKLRMEAIKHKIYNTPGLALAVIDGIKDLCFDINDGKEATEITTELMRWSEETNIHIIIVLHQNKGDNNARGHLGTEVINKAETVIPVAKDADDPELSIVTPEFCREKEFEPFAFSVNEEGIPYITSQLVVVKSNSTGKPNTLTANQIPDETHHQILKTIFNYHQQPTYKELIIQIKLAFEQYGISFGDNKAKAFCTYYDNKKWIQSIKPIGNRYPVYKYTQPV